MSTVRKSKAEIGKGQIDHAKVLAATEEQIAAWKREDDIDDAQFGSPRYVPAVDVRAIRERLGLSQYEFARTYRLSQRTVQEWEQHRREPSESARVLLYAISRNPKALERALQAE